jgi:putative tryptophan/tyrosine transport system substrate-binding protein
MATYIRRREFISTLCGMAAAWPLAARAQQTGTLRRIGFLFGAIPAAQLGSDDLGRGFTQGMRELGYLEGKDFVVEWRSGEGQYERLTELAAELVRLKVDVIVTGSPLAVRPAQQATTTIPIVMAYSTDPVGNGFVASLARPGGNTTGLAGSSDDSAPKQLELLTTVMPKLSRVAILTNPHNPNSAAVMKSAQSAAEKVGLLVVPVEARSLQEIENAFAALAKQSIAAVMVGLDAVFFVHRQQLAQLALDNRLASMFAGREYAAAGGLMSYGESLREFFRRAAPFVDKIFKGAKPGELPIEQPTRFNLVINRKTADALGLTIPPQLYIFADEVIE